MPQLILKDLRVSPTPKEEGYIALEKLIVIVGLPIIFTLEVNLSLEIFSGHNVHSNKSYTKLFS